MRVFEKILCPIDFSETSANALRWTDYLAKRYGSSIVVLHSVEMIGYGGPFSADYGKSVSDAQDALREFVAPLSQPCEMIVGTHGVLAEVADRAERTCSTVIVMGTHGSKGFSHKLIGSTTEEVVRHSKKPVITISPYCSISPENVKGRILIPLEHLDMLATSYSVFDHIIGETDSSVSLMHVVGYKEPIYAAKSEVIPLNTFTLEAQQTHNDLKTLGKAITGRDESLETIVDFGDIAEGILKQASTGKYDFILMGAKKERFLSIYFDSVVYSVLCESPIPVITVKIP
ncbi:universal stress protein [bacterium]|nr:universal stress protein [bacterium]MCI0618351.1 universal stress protein [bacterium]